MPNPRARRPGAAAAPVAEEAHRVRCAAGRAAAGETRPARTDLAELRRQQILDAAETCFCRYGFHSASMAQIARTFGMSAGHIYNYFDSKEAIIAGIVERELDQFIQGVGALHDSHDLQKAALEQIDAGVADKLNFGKSARRLEVLAEAGRNPVVLDMVRRTDAKCRTVLRDLFRQMGADPRDLDAKVAVMMSIFEGLMIRGMRQPDLNRTQVTRVLRLVLSQMLR